MLLMTDMDLRVYFWSTKLKRLQAGEDVGDLLAEIDEELPSDDEDEDPDDAHLTKLPLFQN